MSGLAYLDRYLAGLPRGLESFADHVQKAAVFRQFVSGLPIAEQAHRLPPPLDGLVRAPPPVSAWLSEVQATAVLTSLRDLFFSDDEGFFKYAYDTNRRVLESVFYRVLFKLVSPQRVLRGAEARWAQLHKGMELFVAMRGDRGAEVRLVYPPGLLPDVIATAYSTAFRAAVEVAGARAASFTVVERSRTQTTFHGAWS